MNPLVELLSNAAAEIRALRRRNELLSAKVEMIDLFACVLHTQAASRPVGEGPDIAWALDKEAARIKRADDLPENQRGD